MKRFLLYSGLFVLLSSASCENEQTIKCYPQRISRTIAQGTNARTITADYSYDGLRVDHILWSNYQTHYYTWTENGLLSKVEKKNVQTYNKEELRFSYTDGQADRMDIYNMRLDRFTQEEIDTTHTGYHILEYNGARVGSVTIYTKEAEDFIPVRELEYRYDGFGNMSAMTAFAYGTTDTIEAYTYIYDTQRNPYSSIDLYFDNESHVNNMLQKTDLVSGDVYTYQVVYSPTGFPQQINVKEGDYLSEVVQIDYSCE